MAGLWIVVVPLSLLAAFLVGALLAGLRPGARRRYSVRWISERSAPITPAAEAEVEAVRWSRRTWSYVATLIGLLIVVVLALLWWDPYSDSEGYLGLAVWIVPIALMSLGRSVTTVLSAAREVRGPVRVAHSRAPHLTDYVSRSGLLVSRLCSTLVICVGCAALSVPLWPGVHVRHADPEATLTVLAVLGICWVVSEVLAHVVVQAPAGSSDADSLYWHDQLRAEQLGEICSLPASVGYFAGLLITTSLPHVQGTTIAAVWIELGLWLMLLIVTLSFVAQHLLTRQPSGPHRATPAAGVEAAETV